MFISIIIYSCESIFSCSTYTTLMQRIIVVLSLYGSYYLSFAFPFAFVSILLLVISQLNMGNFVSLYYCSSQHVWIILFQLVYNHLMLYIQVYTRIVCNNDIWVWRIWFYKVKIQVLDFSQRKFKNLNFLEFFAEFFGDCSKRLKRFQSLLTVL